jgi:hypothetical protein
MRAKLILFIGLIGLCGATAQTLEQMPKDAKLAKFHPVKAPQPSGLMLKAFDRVAICGDSITEQKMYSRIMEDYLTMCVPELSISVRQYGWGGEQAPGFLARMTNDCLRFKPTLATTCYGMNDHHYRAYEESIGADYRKYSTAIVEAFKANGVRVIQGSPGCVGKVPGWTKGSNTVEDLNLNLCQLRNIDVDLAKREGVGFADVFWPMLSGGVAAQRAYGADYAIAGRDGVHPGWAGHTVMAYAFLKAMGLKGDVGTYTVNLKRNEMTVSDGHKLVSCKGGEFQIESARYPFCPCVEEGQSVAFYPVCGKDEPSKDNSIRSGMTMVPFNQDLNRLVLIAKGGKASNYKVIWGEQSQTFSARQLAKGINLAAEFPCNPFCAAFAKVDAAVAAKQAFETQQIKKAFRSEDAKKDMEAVAALTEKEHNALVAALKAAFVPVTHTIRIEPQ